MTPLKEREREKETERGKKEKPRRECAMMCWKKAHTSADMQSLGKHVEGMIHLKLLRPWKQKAPFLPLLDEWEARKQGNDAV